MDNINMEPHVLRWTDKTWSGYISDQRDETYAMYKGDDGLIYIALASYRYEEVVSFNLLSYTYNGCFEFRSGWENRSLRTIVELEDMIPIVKEDLGITLELILDTEPWGLRKPRKELVRLVEENRRKEKERLEKHERMFGGPSDNSIGSDPFKDGRSDYDYVGDGLGHSGLELMRKR